MAHECPECYARCHCGGDIDDIVLPSTKYESNCCHCQWDDWDDEPYDEDDWEDDDFDCHKDNKGYCGKAGSEECEFECPYR